MYPWGLPEQANDSSSSSSDDAEVEDIKAKLAALETSSWRMEEMLAKLCANLDLTPNRESRGEAATLGKSGTEELEE